MLLRTTVSVVFKGTATGDGKAIVVAVTVVVPIGITVP
jgi:hypothetical protein